jgi:hypothetical protein
MYFTGRGNLRIRGAICIVQFGGPAILLSSRWFCYSMASCVLALKPRGNIHSGRNHPSCGIDCMTLKCRESGLGSSTEVCTRDLLTCYWMTVVAWN